LQQGQGPPGFSTSRPFTLDTVYDNTASSTTHHVTGNFGLDPYSLPRVDTVSASLRQHIVEGRDVNLALLLVPDDIPTNPRTIELGNGELRLNPAGDPRLQKTLSLKHFITAFNRYKRIMLTRWPQRSVELDRYLDLILSLSNEGDESDFYTYHKMFSAKAASALVQSNVKVDWSKLDQELYLRVFNSDKNNRCQHCHGITHPTEFCPLAIHQASANRRDKNLPHMFNRSQARPRNQDAQGRQIVFHEVCNNFNYESGRKKSAAVDTLLQQERDRGYLIGPFYISPFPIHRINPIGLVEGKYSRKQRLIVDMSAPHDDCVNPSLNSLIDKDKYSLSNVTVDDAINVIKELGPGSVMCSLTIADSQISSPSTRCRVSPNPVSSADRHDVPVTHGGTIEADIELLWSSAVSTRTYQVYQSGVNAFLTFMTMQGFVWTTTLPPISEDILIRFVAHCYRRLLLRYSAIKSYLCGIRFRYLQVGLPYPWTSGSLIRLQTIVQGVKKNQGLISASFTLLLAASKTDPFRKGVTITYTATGNCVCPVASMQAYLVQRHRYAVHKADPLFVTVDGKVLFRTYFIVQLKKLLRLCGYDDNAYQGHSFRIGAATSAASAKVPDHLIQVLGRWSSSCYTRYIRTPQDVLWRAQKDMAYLC
ncbi:uncharacterized protein LOC124136362, partial [Haliotis rufescens]|uniref:uncharacterized protein LOC124136362 n=1 Tax=Haliotis rufescens TaxID=6454 RepID=UPI00201E93E6